MTDTYKALEVSLPDLAKLVSRSSAMEADAKEFMHQLVQQLDYGDSVVFLQMQQRGLGDHPKRWSSQMPEPSDPSYPSSRDKSYLKAARAGMGPAVDSFFKVPSDSKIQHTDILTTLHLASESMRDANGRSTTILLLSDMLQSSYGIEMERPARMPAPKWVSQQKQIGLIPNFAGACVVVVGADSTTGLGVKVRRFWQEYFAAAGGTLREEEYRATPPQARRHLCG